MFILHYDRCDSQDRMPRVQSIGNRSAQAVFDVVSSVCYFGDSCSPDQCKDRIQQLRTWRWVLLRFEVTLLCLYCHQLFRKLEPQTIIAGISLRTRTRVGWITRWLRYGWCVTFYDRTAFRPRDWQNSLCAVSCT
jgi:hypothetical protein